MGWNMRAEDQKLSKQSETVCLISEVSRGEYTCKQLKLQFDLDVRMRTVWRIKWECELQRWMSITRKGVSTGPRKMVIYNEKWERVIFSDDNKFNLDGPNGYKFYWHDLRRVKFIFSRKHREGNGRGRNFSIWEDWSAHERKAGPSEIHPNAQMLSFLLQIRNFYAIWKYSLRKWSRNGHYEF